MRLLLIIVLGVLFVTYTWDWIVLVPAGSMDTKSYTQYYCSEVVDQFRYFFEGVEKIAHSAKESLPRTRALGF